MKKIVIFDPTVLEPDVLDAFRSFWATVPHIFEGGMLNLNAILNELHDYHEMMEEVGKVYCEVTGGRVSKQNTAASVVLEFYREEIHKAYDEGYQNCKEDMAPEE
jgi:hypothetical protein